MSVYIKYALKTKTQQQQQQKFSLTTKYRNRNILCYQKLHKKTKNDLSTTCCSKELKKTKTKTNEKKKPNAKIFYLNRPISHRKIQIGRAHV